MLKKLGLAFLLAFFSIATSFGQDDILNPNHPDRYVVVKGDTLWDISGRFLRAPWLWPEVWQGNPQIENPHLIYPGDVITLIYVNGQPRLSLSRGTDVKLQPGVRITPNAEAIPTISIEKIHPFLNRSGVMTQNEYDGAAYVLATSDEQITVATGDKVYVRGIKDTAVDRYKLVRKGREYINPPDGIGVGGGKAGESLGFEADELGDAQVTDFAEISSVVITRALKETLAGDRVMPAPDDKPFTHFFPRAPKEDITGAIVGVADGAIEIGQYSVIAINLGQQDKMEVGFVLDLFKKGRMVDDTYLNPKSTATTDGKKPKREVRLPDELVGEVLIFRVFDRISYALITNTKDAVQVYDLVKTPK